VDGSIRPNCQFEGDTFWDAQTVNADERRGNVFWLSNPENFLSHRWSHLKF